VSIVIHSYVQRNLTEWTAPSRSHGAEQSSQVEIKVWRRSQGKRKKRKVLVASASHSLGELVKKQESELRTSFVSLITQFVDHADQDSRFAYNVAQQTRNAPPVGVDHRIKPSCA